MAELEARFESDPIHGWRKPLPVGDEFVLGRHPGDGGWPTEWDNFISRQHATLTWDGGTLRVSRKQSAGNPIFFKGSPADEFAALPGDTFRIGNTVFTVLQEEPAPIEVAASAKELSKVRFENPDQRIEVLAALPDLIRQSQDEGALEKAVVDALLRGIPNAMAAAIVRLPPEGSSTGPLGVVVTASARRGGNPEEVRASRKLVHDAIRRRLCTSHVWGLEKNLTGSGDSKFSRAEFSMTDPGTDWAMCAPLLDEASAGYGVYVAGRTNRDLKSPDSVSKDPTLRADLKFAQLTADIFGALRQVHDLQRRQSLLLRFLSPRVVRVVVNEPNRSVEEVLEAKPAAVTVLFCDLRGSCRIVEEGSSDLGKLWESVSGALGIMTDAIVQFDGVVGDFQGDAAMGFFGWPLGGDDQIEQACRAALSIRRHFSQATGKKGGALSGFACGLGLAHGLAIAGRLGTMDQFKVGVFGPVVNLAARLESMTKQVRVPILVDDGVAKHVLSQKSAGWARARRVAVVRPAGMKVAVPVSELLPPVGSDSLPEPRRMDYESALEAFKIGKWADTRNLLKFLTGDGPSEFLIDFMNRHPDGPPPSWDGVISMEKK